MLISLLILLYSCGPTRRSDTMKTAVQAARLLSRLTYVARRRKIQIYAGRNQKYLQVQSVNLMCS